MVLGTPTAADAAGLEDRVERDVTFTTFGRRVTCTVVGTSRYELMSDRRAVYGATTAVVDTDPECATNLLGILAGVSLVNSSADPHQPFASTFATSEEADHVEVTGRLGNSSPFPTEVTGSHIVVFSCNDEASDQCLFSFETAPK